MHKIFAKPLFLGKKVVFLPQCHSTNDELAAMVKNENPPEGTVIYTDSQLSGKGQRGNKWEADPDKNILMSLLLKPKKLAVKNQYYLNLIIGLAILDFLKEKLRSKDLRLKWPNDVYVNGQKISGILVENSLKGTVIDSSIIGIGFNLNQETFDIPNATSLFLESNQYCTKEEIMEDILQLIEYWYMKLSEGRFEDILSSYHDSLFWKDEIHTFQSDKEILKGIIRGINEVGRLIIETTDGELSFDVQEVRFVE